jgi:hypothetical protein
MNTRWGESIDCTDYENEDAEVELYLHYCDVDSSYYLLGEHYPNGVSKMGWSHEIKYCPFCGRKL